MTSDPSLWPYLIPALPSLVVAAGTALGVWWSRQKAPAEARLITVQADVATATVEKTKAEAESLAVSSLEKALVVADRTIDRLKAEKDKAEEGVKILELQLEREVRWRKANGWPEPPESEGK